jgi:hypothetical protein
MTVAVSHDEAQRFVRQRSTSRISKIEDAVVGGQWVVRVLTRRHEWFVWRGENGELCGEC